MPREYCRNCGSDATGKNICSNCGADPNQGYQFCNHCATEILPRAVVCILCRSALPKPLTETSLTEPSVNATKVAAISMLAGFLLPWINTMQYGTFRGVDLYQYAALQQLQQGEIAALINTLYLLPCISILILFYEFKHLRFMARGTARVLTLLTGFLPVCFIVWLFREQGVEAYRSMAMGLLISSLSGGYFLVTETLAGVMALTRSTEGYSGTIFLRRLLKFTGVIMFVSVIAVAIIWGIGNFLSTQPLQLSTVGIVPDSIETTTTLTDTVSVSNPAATAPEITDLISDTEHPERKELLEVLRTSVNPEFNRPVSFVLYAIRSNGSYAFLFGKPVNKNGTEVNYKRTSFKKDYRKQGWDNNIQALFKKVQDQWVIVEYAVGSSVVSYYAWPSKYGFSKKLIGVNEQDPAAPELFQGSPATSLASGKQQKDQSIEIAGKFNVHINKIEVEVTEKVYNYLRHTARSAPCKGAVKCSLCKASGYVTDDVIVTQKKDVRAIKSCEDCKGEGYYCH
jgi:hypothetical protein